MYSARKNKQQTKVTQEQGRKIKRRNHTSADPTIKKKEQLYMEHTNAGAEK